VTPKKKLPLSPGRPKGSENKITKAMRELVKLAAEVAGDRRRDHKLVKASAEGLKLAEPPLGGALGYLTDMAEQHPQAFLGLIGKTIEKHVTVEVEERERVMMRDYTGLRLEDLPESVLRKIEKARAAAAAAALEITQKEKTT
jgi:hypothetical protein